MKSTCQIIKIINCSNTWCRNYHSHLISNVKAVHCDVVPNLEKMHEMTFFFFVALQKANRIDI